MNRKNHPLRNTIAKRNSAWTLISSGLMLIVLPFFIPLNPDGLPNTLIVIGVLFCCAAAYLFVDSARELRKHEHARLEAESLRRSAAGSSPHIPSEAHS